MLRASGPVNDGLSSHLRAAICRIVLQIEEDLRRGLGPVLSSQPYFNSLFSIYLAELEGRTLFQACLTTDEVASKAHRRAGRLEELGAIRRTDDTRDHRRTDLSLTQATRDAIGPLVDRMASAGLQIASLVGVDGQPSQALIQKRSAWYQTLDDTDFGTETMSIVRGKIIAGGRVALPAEMRRALGLQNGDSVYFELKDDEVRIRPAKSALKRVQERLRPFAPEEGLVSDQLIAGRRAEAGRE